MLVLGLFLVVGHPFGSLTTWLYARQFDIASIETLDAQLQQPDIVLIHARAVLDESPGMSITEAKQILTGGGKGDSKVVSDALKWEVPLSEDGAIEQVRALLKARKAPSKAAPIVVFSELKGLRAYMAMAALKAVGYANVINGGHTDHVDLRYRAMLADKKRAAATERKQGKNRKGDPEL